MSDQVRNFKEIFSHNEKHISIDRKKEKHVRLKAAFFFDRDLYMSRVMGKPVFEVYNQVPHKPGCSVTDV